MLIMPRRLSAALKMMKGVWEWTLLCALKVQVDGVDFDAVSADTHQTGIAAGCSGVNTDTAFHNQALQRKG